MELSSIANFFKYDCMIHNIMSSLLLIIVSITVFNLSPNLIETIVQKTYLSVVYHVHVYFSSNIQHVLFWEMSNLPI